MKYLLLAYEDTRWCDGMSVGERLAFENACLANDDMLRKSGRLLAVEGVQNSSAIATVQVQNGKVSIIDGPFVEARQQLVRLFFINARDLNEAIHVALSMPHARIGSIEVRPMIQLAQTRPEEKP